MKAIEIQHSQVVGVSSKQDGSVRVAFTTPELRPSEAGALIQLHGKNVCISLVPEDVAPPEIIKVDTERAQKSPSQRLHNVLFVYWRQLGGKGNFQEFYVTQMERLIDSVKEQLDPP